MYRDLTKGSISKGLILFSLPMIAGNLMQQLYNIADTLIVGQAPGNVGHPDGHFARSKGRSGLCTGGSDRRGRDLDRDPDRLGTGGRSRVRILCALQEKDSGKLNLCTKEKQICGADFVNPPFLCEWA